MKCVRLDRRALRKFHQKSNPSRQEIQNNLHANSPAIPSLTKNRCAAVLKKAQHRASLTEPDDARTTTNHRTDTAGSPTTALPQKRQGIPHALLQNATKSYNKSRAS